MNREIDTFSSILSIRISTDGFCFCTYNSQQTDSIKYYRYDCDIRVPLMTNFDTAWEQSGFAKNKYTNIQVISATDFTTIPLEYDNKDEYQEIYNSCFPKTGIPIKILSNKLNTQNLTILFSIEKEIYNRLLEIGDVKFYSPISIMLGFLAKYGINDEKYILANYQAGKSWLIAMEKEVPLLINSFNTPDKHDQLYYLLAIWNELNLSQTENKLLLCGDNNADEIEMLAMRFIRNIIRVNTRELFTQNLLNKIGNIPFDLQALILCE